MNLDKNILAPDVTVTARCSACNEVVLYEREQCPYCGITLDREKMRASAMKMIPIDRAISSANTIRTFNPAAVLFLLAALINPYLEWADSPIRFDYYFTYLCIAAAFVVGKWFWTHGRLQSQDPEYQLAKKTMRKSLILWLAVNIVNLGILIISRNLIR